MDPLPFPKRGTGPRRIATPPHVGPYETAYDIRRGYAEEREGERPPERAPVRAER
jgi:hypothetical protein